MTDLVVRTAFSTRIPVITIVPFKLCRADEGEKVQDKREKIEREGRGDKGQRKKKKKEKKKKK